MSRTFIGIDPGFSGAIAKLYSDSAVHISDMPTAPNPKGKTELSLHDVLEALDLGGDRATLWLEKVSSRPGQGVSSVWRFAQQVGAIEMAAVAHKHELRYVTPATWKAYFGLSADKGVARAYAAKRFPEVAHMFSRVRDDGRAEALLIALYGKEHAK